MIKNILFITLLLFSFTYAKEKNITNELIQIKQDIKQLKKNYENLKNEISKNKPDSFLSYRLTQIEDREEKLLEIESDLAKATLLYKYKVDNINRNENKQIEVYKTLIDSNSNFYANSFSIFALVAAVFALFSYFFTNQWITKKISHFINKKTNKTIRLLEEKIKSVDMLLKNIEDGRDVAELEINKLISILKNTAERSQKERTDEDKRLIKIINENLSNTKEKDFDYYFFLALEYTDQKEYKKAIEAYLKAIELNPTNDIVFTNLGIIYSLDGKHSQAIKVLEKATELNPMSYNGFLQLGIEYDGFQKYKEAINVLQKATKINPINYAAFSNLGTVYTNDENYSDAIKALNKSIELYPLNEVGFYQLGIVYTNTEDYSKALSVLEKSIEINPINPQAFLQIGVVNAHNENYNEAIKSFHKSIELDSTDYRIFYNLGIVYEKTNNLEKAIISHEKSININPNSGSKSILNDLLKKSK